MTTGNKGVWQINICVLLLGGTALFAKLISLPADAITFFRSIFACLALVSIMIMTRSVFRRPSREDYLPILFTGLLTGGHWVAYFHAIQLSSVAVGIISLYTFPIITSFLEPLLDHERIRFGNIVRAAIVFAGLLLIVPDFELSNQATAGVLWGLASAILFSIRNITVKKKLGHLSSLVTMCYQLFIISIMLLPFVSFQESLMIDNRLALLVVLSVLFTATPHVLLVASLRCLKAATASLILCLHPLYSILFAGMLISEIPSFKVIMGAVLIFSISLYESIHVGVTGGKKKYFKMQATPWRSKWRNC
jgi:drug/metabolite transporter (DMT)-like permease